MARRRNRAEGDGGQQSARHPLLKLLLADVVVQNGSRLLRQKASQRLLPTPEQPTPLPKRLATLAAMRLATRSWPGAAIVGAGMLAHGLYKRGKARRKERGL
jgi:hypothetical protein